MTGALIFLHIPKTAGTTLRDVILREYPPGSVHTIRGKGQAAAIEAFKGLPAQERQAIAVLQGHIAFGLHDHLTQPVRYVTVLREPVDRAVSHYRQVRAHLDRGMTYPDRPWLREAGQMSLVDYVRHGTSHDLRNGQTRQLAGVLHGWDALTADHVDPPDMLERATTNLRDVMVVTGLTERFDETLLLLRRRLGWKLPVYEPRNVGRPAGTATPLPPDVVAAIEEANHQDVQLYRDAARRFDEEVQHEGPSFAHELRRFRFLNRRWRTWSRVRRSARHRGGVVLRRVGVRSER